MKIIHLFLVILLFVACDKPNPEPEKMDPIYNDIQSELNIVIGQVTTAEKDIQDKQKDLDNVEPQTGQIKFAKQRLETAIATRAKLQQKQRYLEIRLQSRKDWARESYMKAFNKKEPWPNPKEYEEYQIQKAQETAPRQWNVKQRIEEAKLAPKSTPKH